MSVQKRFALTWVVVLLLFFAVQSHAAVYDLNITADNAYVFGFGDENGVAIGNLGPVVINTTAGDIFGPSGPETYTNVSSATHSYVYIAAWADDAVANGVLATFISGGELQFSTGVWEVFATGDKTSTAAQALTRESINAQIGLANPGNGHPDGSGGWVRLPPAPSIAEDVGGVLYRMAAGLGMFDPAFVALFDASAGWLWYDNGASSNPFDYTANGDGGWLIFRSGIPLMCDAAETGLWNTGVNASGNVLTDGSLDPHYLLASGPSPVSPDDPTYKSGGNPTSWLANDAAGTAGSAWIGRTAVSASENGGTYVYELTVDVPNYSPLPTVTGRWSADNSGVDILIDGNTTGQSATSGFYQWQTFSISGADWTPGQPNTVTFVVENISLFQGLRVEWCVSPSEAAATPEPIPTMGEYGLIALALLLMACAIWLLRRTRTGAAHA